MSQLPEPRPTPAPLLARPRRYEKVLREEISACEDPICCCEAEPRWLLRQNGADDAGPGEWEGLERTPAGEL